MCNRMLFYVRKAEHEFKHIILLIDTPRWGLESMTIPPAES